MNAETFLGISPLMGTVHQNAVESARLVLNHRRIYVNAITVDVNKPCYGKREVSILSQYAPLLFRMFLNQKDVMVNQKDGNGNTVFMLAAQLGLDVTTRIILQVNGIEIGHSKANELTAAYIAHLQRHIYLTSNQSVSHAEPRQFRLL